MDEWIDKSLAVNMKNKWNKIYENFEIISSCGNTFIKT